MDYLDFEICIGPGEGRTYPVHVVRSPAGEKRSTMRFPFDELELRNQIQTLQIALLKSATTRRDMVQPQEQVSVKDFGRMLFDAVISDEVRSCYRISRDKALSEGKGLRLRLRIEAPDLAALPWEFLYDESEGDFICLSNETPIVRYLELDRPPTPIRIEPPLRILGMIAAPEDRARLNVSRERLRMSEAVADLESRGLVTLTWLEGETWQDLQRAMRKGPWHVFHFVGHGGFDAGSGEGMLALTKEDGTTYRLPATKLGRLLADHRALRLAVLNSCEGAQASETDIFSSTASVLIRRGIPAVVAMQYEITDRAAIQFGRAFYESIAEGLPVDAAVGEARKSISFSMAHTVEWGTPVLHMRSPDGRLFDIDADTPPKPEPAAPPTPEAVVEVAVPVEPTIAPTKRPDPPRPAEPAVRGEAPSTEPEESAPAALSARTERPPSHREAPTQKPAAQREGIDPKVLWGGVSAAAVLILAAAAFFLWPSLGDEIIMDGQPVAGGVEESLPPPIGRVLLIPATDTLRTGGRLRIGVSLVDSLGNGMNERTAAPDVLTWTAEPDGIVTITPNAEGLGATVQGEALGTVSITATVAEAASADRPADTKRITVLPDEAQMTEVLNRYLVAERSFNDPAKTNAEVVAAYQGLSTGDRRALVESEQIASPAVLDSVQQAVAGLVTLFDGTVARGASDTLTVSEKEAVWQTYLSRADSIRSSPSTARTVTVLDSLRTIEQRSATLVSFTTCRTGGLDCPASARDSVFTVGQQVYFSAKVKLPASEQIRWEWIGPDATVVNEGSDTLPGPAPEYRTYRSLRDTDQPGRYELRLYNEPGHLIGRRVFTVVTPS